MEPGAPTPIETVQKRSTPWGLFIGLFLILAVVVAGAYYSFTKRYQPMPHASVTRP